MARLLHGRWTAGNARIEFPGAWSEITVRIKTVGVGKYTQAVVGDWAVLVSFYSSAQVQEGHGCLDPTLHSHHLSHSCPGA